MSTTTAPWWRRHLPLLAVLATLVIAAVIAVVVVVDRRDPAPVDEPVTASTLEGYSLRGSLAGLGDLQEEVDVAADAWRSEDVGGAEEPPDPGERIEVLWAGDLSDDTLAGATTYGLQPDDDAPGGRRIVVLRSDDHVATFRAPLDADGQRGDSFRIEADSDGTCLECVAVIPLADQLSLLADPDGRPQTDDGPTSVEAAFPYGRGDDPTPVVVDVPVVDGLLVNPGDGAMRHESVRAVPEPEDTPGLVLTTGGAVESDDVDTLWARLTEPGTAPATWTALRDAYAASDERGRDQRESPLVELWDAPTLSDGSSPTVVALASFPQGGDDRSWEVSAAFERDDDQQEVRDPGDWSSTFDTVSLGSGTAGRASSLALPVPPIAARWYRGTGGDEARLPELVVVGPPEVAAIDILAGSGPAHVDGSAVAWARPDPAGWVREGADVGQVEPTDVPPVVVVGYTADGTPLSPLTGD
ncbi:hypothetical protein IF650_06385 [Cellulosimicrobium terreum]|nr:hypothetical protein [Cellulosimicrobium terreum]